MLEIIKVIILGIIEGITEWLPISSTGHMILVEQFLKLKVSLHRLFSPARYSRGVQPWVFLKTKLK